MASISVKNLDLSRLQILNFRIHNVTTAERTTLAASLTGTHQGLAVWDTTLNDLYIWDGTVFKTIGSIVSGGMTFKGVVAHSATEPTSPAIGDFYIFNSAGNNTWEGTTAVQIGDSAIWNGTTWNFLQANAVSATETIEGLNRLATQAEVNTGTNPTAAVTPATLQTKLASYSRKFTQTSVNLVAGTPFTITHNLGLSNRNAFTYSVFASDNSAVLCDVDSTSVNACTITADINVTGATVTIIG
jgi:hypothetical protein